jgi:ADP-ribosyl-[dinitrogen reductase] hydrolase
LHAVNACRMSARRDVLALAMGQFSQPPQFEIAQLSVGVGLGRIGLTSCPGRIETSVPPGCVNPKLSVDLDAICAWGATAVITLIETCELKHLHVEGLAQEVERRGMRWLHLPITDFSIPDAAFEHAWGRARAEIHSHLRATSAILVHCRGGLGRSGMIAARLLIEHGMGPSAAIDCVRSVRPGAIETIEQIEYVLGLSG